MKWAVCQFLCPAQLEDDHGTMYIRLQTRVAPAEVRLTPARGVRVQIALRMRVLWDAL